MDEVKYDMELAILNLYRFEAIVYQGRWAKKPDE